MRASSFVECTKWWDDMHYPEKSFAIGSPYSDLILIFDPLDPTRPVVLHHNSYISTPFRWVPYFSSKMLYLYRFHPVLSYYFIFLPPKLREWDIIPYLFFFLWHKILFIPFFSTLIVVVILFHSIFKYPNNWVKSLFHCTHLLHFILLHSIPLIVDYPYIHSLSLVLCSINQ